MEDKKLFSRIKQKLLSTDSKIKASEEIMEDLIHQDLKSREKLPISEYKSTIYEDLWLEVRKFAEDFKLKISKKNYWDTLETIKSKLKSKDLFYSFKSEPNEIALSFNSELLMDKFNNLNLISPEKKINLIDYEFKNKMYHGFFYEDKFFNNLEKLERFKNKKQARVLFKVNKGDKIYYSFNKESLSKFIDKEKERIVIEKSPVNLKKLIRARDIYVKIIKDYNLY